MDNSQRMIITTIRNASGSSLSEAANAYQIFESDLKAINALRCGWKSMSRKNLERRTTMKYYEVSEYDGLGTLRYAAEWDEDQVRRHCSKYNEEFRGEGNSFEFDEYNAGTENLPSWRSSSFTYDPVDYLTFD